MATLEPATILLYSGVVMAGVCWVVVFYRVSGEDRGMGKMCYLFPPMAPMWALFHLGEFKFEAAGFVVAAGLVAGSFADWRRLDGPPVRAADANTASAARTAPEPEKPERPAPRGTGPEPVTIDRATRGLVADPDPGRVAPQRPVAAEPKAPPETKGTKHSSKAGKRAAEPAPVRAPVFTASSDVSGMTVPELLEGLKAKPIAVRTRVIFELAKRGAAAEEAVPELTKLLEDPADSIRDAAKFAIRKIENP